MRQMKTHFHQQLEKYRTEQLGQINNTNNENGQINHEVNRNEEMSNGIRVIKQEALRYYNSNVRIKARTYSDVKSLMVLHFNSPDV